MATLQEENAALSAMVDIQNAEICTLREQVATLEWQLKKQNATNAADSAELEYLKAFESEETNREKWVCAVVLMAILTAAVVWLAAPAIANELMNRGLVK